MPISIRLKFGYLPVSTLHFMLNKSSILNLAWAQQNSWNDSTLFPVGTLQCTDHPELIDVSLRSLSNISQFLEILEEKPVVRGTGSTHCKWAASLSPTHDAGHSSLVWKGVTQEPTHRILNNCRCLNSYWNTAELDCRLHTRNFHGDRLSSWGKLLFRKFGS